MLSEAVSSALADMVLALPADAQILALDELAPQVRAKLGPMEPGRMVVTRPGFRVTGKLIGRALAELMREFATPSRISDAVLRYSETHGRDPLETLEEAFDAIATLVESRVLLPSDSAELEGLPASLAPGRRLGGHVIARLVQALSDTEVYRAVAPDGRPVALKIAREAESAALAHEAGILEHLSGRDSPRLLACGTEGGRAYIAMEWRDGVAIQAATRKARLAGDWRKLHRIVHSMLAAFGRLHAAGVVHGDIHPGNILVSDEGRITLLDFGRARLGAGSTSDPARAGLPHFHEPEMAAAVLAGASLPAANPVGEQYAVAALASLLLTGRHAIEPAAESREVLRRIIHWPATPFVARGAPAWPSVERVLGRALAKAPAQRFANMGAFASAFARTRPPRRLQELPPFAAGILRRDDGDPLKMAWLTLRAALLTEEPEWLAAADFWAWRAGHDRAGIMVRAAIARANSDRSGEAEALDAFPAAAGEAEPGRALSDAARLLTDTKLREIPAAPLTEWALGRFQAAWRTGDRSPPVLHAALALHRAGVIAMPSDLLPALRDLPAGITDPWLWSLAQLSFPTDDFLSRAVAAGDGHALLRLYQIDGDARCLGRARRLAAVMTGDVDRAILLVELQAPERAEPPPFGAE